MGHWLRLGDLELLVVSDGVLRQDAGAVFGLTPRLMWEPYLPQLDDKYRFHRLNPRSTTSPRSANRNGLPAASSRTTFTTQYLTTLSRRLLRLQPVEAPERILYREYFKPHESRLLGVSA